VKILYVGPYPPARDGIGVYTRVLAGAMRGLGHEVAVLADRHTPGALDQAALGLRRRPFPQHDHRLPGDAVEEGERCHPSHSGTRSAA
jgi:hypothetical protein